MATQKKDHWSAEAYQHAASFVPKLATKIVQWLDPKENDSIIDIGCGDGVLSLDIARILNKSKGGHIHGIDSSPKMIEAAGKAAKDKELESVARFEVLDANEFTNSAQLFNKAFSNAALHWILRPEEKREVFFRSVRNALSPGGTFAFEMGGLGNVSELRGVLFLAIARRVGLAKAREADPWFFPDEDWITDVMEKRVGGWKIEKIEREWRPTMADAGGVDAWIRLMGKQFFEALPEEEREACIKEVVEVLEAICAKPAGGYMFSYVRLRVLARKVE